MPLRMWGQYIIQDDAPAEDPVIVGTLWRDTATGLLKVCTAVAPYTFTTLSGGAGTVTSVGMTVPTGLSVSGSPVTTSGTLAVSLTAGYMIPGGGISGQMLTSQGAATPIWTTPTTGTVTSVALTVPSLLSVSGSPVTSAGTFAVTWNAPADRVPYFSALNTLATSADLTFNGTLLSVNASALVGTPALFVQVGDYSATTGFGFESLWTFAKTAIAPSTNFATAFTIFAPFNSPSDGAAMAGFAAITNSLAADTHTYEQLQGAIVNSIHRGSGAANFVQGIYVIAGASSSGAVSTLTQIYVGSSVTGGSAVATHHGIYVDSPFTVSGGTIGVNYAFYAATQADAQTTHSYGLWIDDQGVYRIKSDNTFNSVYQAIPALYNPQFTKYTPGAANYERIVMGQFNSNVAEIGTEAGGTGTLRNLKLIGAGITFGTPVNGGVVYSTASVLAYSAAGTSGQVLTSAGAGTPTWTTPTTGTVTSVAMTVPTGLSVSGSPITTTGTLAVTLTSGYMIPGGGSAGQYLQSNGASAPSFSTATLPSTATGTGTILRADGTNWVASTATYPNTVTSGHVMVASGANVWAGQAPAALTRVDDTNVTLTLGGSPSTALINAASLTLGWTGTLAGSRGGTGYGSVKLAGIAYGLSTNYIDGTGTAGADNTAQTVKTIAIPANTLTQVGDRVTIRIIYRPDTGTAMTPSVTVNGVALGSATTGTAASYQMFDITLEYIDSTHANVIIIGTASNGALSMGTTGTTPNVAGFDWTASQDVDLDQNAISNNHLVVTSMTGTVYPKGVVAA